jgi:hypothetical protein
MKLAFLLYLLYCIEIYYGWETWAGSSPSKNKKNKKIDGVLEQNDKERVDSAEMMQQENKGSHTLSFISND